MAANLRKVKVNNMVVAKKAVAKKSASMSKAADRKQDAKTMKGMTPKAKAAYKKADVAMDKKKPSVKADARMDRTLASKVKKQFPMKRGK